MEGKYYGDVVASGPAVNLRALCLALTAVVSATAQTGLKTYNLEPIGGFEENRGQVGFEFRYSLRGRFYISDKGYTLGPDFVGFEFIGRNPDSRVSTSDTMAAAVNVIKGREQAQWLTGVRQVRAVRYQNAYPNVDLEYRIEQASTVLVRLVLHPGADARLIRQRVSDASVETGADDVPFVRVSRRRLLTVPAVRAYQQQGASDTLPVSAKWVAVDASNLQLEVAPYDATLPLVVEYRIQSIPDRVVGTHYQASTGLLLAGLASGDVKAPVRPTSGTLGNPDAGVCSFFVDNPVPCSDAFIARYDGAGVLRYVTYLSGAGLEQASAVVADAEGSVWVTGSTESMDFPVSSNAAQTAFAGPLSHPSSIYSEPEFGDIFLSKLDSGGRLVYSTLLGGPEPDEPSQLYLDARGNVHVVGRGSAGLPVTPGALVPSLCENCSFAAKLGGSGSLSYLTYLPVLAMVSAVDGSGALHFAGSAQANTPVTAGAYDPSYNGGSSDVYLAKLSPNGTSLEYATFVGSAGWDFPHGLVVDSKNNAWVNVAVESTASPDTLEMFLLKVNPAGSRVEFTRPSVAGALARNAPDQVFLLSGYGSGPTSVTNPGGMVTNACGTQTIAEFNQEGILQHLVLHEREGFSGFTSTGALAFVGYDQQGHPATLRVRDLTEEPRRWLSCAVNAAGMSRGPIAPGEILSLLGSGLGSVTGTSAVPDTTGRFPRELAGTRVYFDGVPAPILYAQHSQVNAIAPFSLVPGRKVRITVEFEGNRMEMGEADVAAAYPQVFTSNGTGSGFAAALNENGTVNRATNPARKGSVVSLFLTGTGKTSPALIEGEIARSVDAKPTAQIAIEAAGVIGLLDTLYYGLSPGSVNSLTQINVRLPDSAPILGEAADSLRLILHVEGERTFPAPYIYFQR